MPDNTSFSANASMCNGIVVNEPRFAAISKIINPANLFRKISPAPFPRGHIGKNRSGKSLGNK
jgi:hypothetical protein